MALQDIINSVNFAYRAKTDAKSLAEALVKLEGVLENGALSSSNRENAEALSMRLSGKFELTKFLLQPSRKNADLVKQLLAEYDETSKKSGYAKTAQTVEEISSLIDRIVEVIGDLFDYERKILDGDRAMELLKQALGAADRASDRLKAAAFQSVIGGNVPVLDIDESIGKFISGVKDRAQSALIDETRAATRDGAQEISKKYRSYDYFPSAEYDEGGKANAVVLSSPLIEDVKLYAVNNRQDRNKKLMCINLAGLDEGLIEALFDSLVGDNADALLLGAETLTDEARMRILKDAIKLGKNGARAFIHDPIGDGSLYGEALKAAQEAGLSVMDVSSEFISLPPFAQVVSELIEKEFITEAQADILKTMPFLGFMGLNEIVVAGNKWQDRGRRISERNKAAARRYLARVKAPYMFVDQGWGDFSEFEKSLNESGEFDYDGIKEVDVANVRKIVECKAPVFAKCGMAVRYCTSAGGDASVWAKLSREEMLERLTIATNIVYRLLMVPTKPIVELLDDLDNPTAGGLCCDGGKAIKYKYSCALSYSWVQECVVHECFHALQAKLRNGGWSRWYFDELGVTQGRVNEWKKSNNIYDHNTNSKLYKVHIVEGDARAFEFDCAVGRDYYWNEIDFD